MLLASCGGGGESLEVRSAAPNSAALGTGLAAVGAPVVGGNVVVQCGSGTTANATTDNQGQFSFGISRLSFPCLARVQGGTINGTANTQTLHGAMPTAGRVNITPLSELLLARLTLAAPASSFANMSATLSAAITADGLAAAQTQLLNYLSGIGVNTSTLAAFAIHNGVFAANAGDSHDQVLEQLAARLSANLLSLSQATSDAISLTPPGPCSAATGFCWPQLAYKVLTEGRANDKNEPEAKFHEHDVDVTVDATSGAWAKTVVLKADKVGKVKNFDLAAGRSLSFNAKYQSSQPGTCHYATPAGENCYEALQAAVVMICGASALDDFILMPSAVVQKDSASEIKKEAASVLYGLSFQRVTQCAPASTTFNVDTSGNTTDENGSSLGLIGNNIGKSADKRLERKFWRVTSGTQTRYVGIESGTKNNIATFTLLVSQ